MTPGEKADVVCVVCGGRGGWWIDLDQTHRATCSRCNGTGWEPSAVVARLLSTPDSAP